MCKNIDASVGTTRGGVLDKKLSVMGYGNQRWRITDTNNSNPRTYKERRKSVSRRTHPLVLFLLVMSLYGWIVVVDVDNIDESI